MKHDNTN